MSSLSSPSVPLLQPAQGDCRCLCGSLLARLVDGAVELKCRRCKRTHVLPLADGVAPVRDGLSR